MQIKRLFLILALGIIPAVLPMAPEEPTKKQKTEEMEAAAGLEELGVQPMELEKAEERQTIIPHPPALPIPELPRVVAPAPQQPALSPARPALAPQERLEALINQLVDEISRYTERGAQVPSLLEEQTWRLRGAIERNKDVYRQLQAEREFAERQRKAELARREAEQVKNKKLNEERNQAWAQYEEWVKNQNPEKVTLQSSDGGNFNIPVRLAMLSGTIKNLIEDSGTGDPIPLPNIDNKTLDSTLKLLRMIEFMQWRSARDHLFYIPREFQVFTNVQFNKSTKNLSNDAKIKQVVELLRAANYLDIPLLINSMAKLVANTVQPQERDSVLQNLLAPADQRAQAAQALQAMNLNYIATLPKDLWRFIARHLVHLRCDITEEYSIADAIKEEGMENVIRSEHHRVLARMKLTSLFGINLLPNNDKVSTLYLNDNCFFDLSMDLQGVAHPFESFTNLLRLDLYNCSLFGLSNDLLAGLRTLETLNMHNNHFATLPDGIFADLGNLIMLDLHNNGIQRLPENLLNPLVNLHTLFLQGNQLTELPAGLLGGLVDLEQLNLADNQIESIPDGFLNGLIHLGVVNLTNNKLRTLSQAAIEGGFAQLRILELTKNPMKAAERARIRAFLPAAVKTPHFKKGPR